MCMWFRQRKHNVLLVLAWRKRYGIYSVHFTLSRTIYETARRRRARMRLVFFKRKSVSCSCTRTFRLWTSLPPYSLNRVRNKFYLSANYKKALCWTIGAFEYYADFFKRKRVSCLCTRTFRLCPSLPPYSLSRVRNKFYLSASFKKALCCTIGASSTTQISLNGWESHAIPALPLTPALQYESSP